MSPPLRRARLLLAALAWPWAPAAAPRPPRCEDSTALPVVVRETPEHVSVDIRLPAGSDPGRVEVRLDERTLVIVAEDPGGRTLCSAPLTLATPATEAGATAAYDGEGALTVTLRRPTPLRPSGRPVR